MEIIGLFFNIKPSEVTERTKSYASIINNDVLDGILYMFHRLYLMIWLP